MLPNRPTIAVIGAAGSMGSRIVRRLLDAQYTVSVFDTNLLPLQVMQGAEPLITVFADPVDACLSADVVILAIPYQAEHDFATRVGDVLQQRIVVSMTNPLTPSLDDVVTPHDESAAEHLAHLMPHARIVKALNSISVAAFDTAVTTRPIFDTFVASDDREAARVVERIITSMGFRPWYVGNLILSRTLERMSALLIGVAVRYGLQGALGWHIEQVQPEHHADV